MEFYACVLWCVHLLQVFFNRASKLLRSRLHEREGTLALVYWSRGWALIVSLQLPGFGFKDIDTLLWGSSKRKETWNIYRSYLLWFFKDTYTEAYTDICYTNNSQHTRAHAPTRMWTPTQMHKCTQAHEHTDAHTHWHTNTHKHTNPHT